MASASKALARVSGMDQAVCDRLERCKIYTCHDLLSYSPFDIMHLADVGEPLLSATFNLVCQSVVPPAVRVLKLHQQSKSKPRFLSTLLPDLDKALHGGIPCGTLTEIVGPPGCGKTQFCMQSCVVGAMPATLGDSDGSVLYIDTEGAFRPERLVEMAKNRYPETFSAESLVTGLIRRVLVFTAKTCRELIDLLGSLEEIIIAHNVKLIVVDSVASLVRKEFDGRQNLRDRDALLMRAATAFKYFAEEFAIPVIVTNHITTKFDRQQELGESGYATAALGNTWSHSVNTRLILEYATSNTRQLRIAKSPVAPFCSLACRITIAGLEQCGILSGPVYGDTTAATAILVRTNVNPLSTYN